MVGSSVELTNSFERVNPNANYIDIINKFEITPSLNFRRLSMNGYCTTVSLLIICILK